MIAIKKRPEPEGLKELRDWTIREGYTPEQAYAALQNPLKKTVRDQLIKEQGHLCAYCMCKIPRENVDLGIAPVVIEHYVPRKPIDGKDIHQGLDYNNLLAVCNGNRRSSVKQNEESLTCDAHRKNLEFKKVNPCDPATLTSIFYNTDGTIDATDPDVKHDLQTTLNLNCPTSPLVAERKGVLDGLISDMGENVPDLEEGPLLAYCKSRLEKFEDETDPKTPYVGILSWYLKDMVNKLSSTLEA